MLKKGLDYEAMLDENIIPELDISCRNLMFDEQIGTNCIGASQSMQHEIHESMRATSPQLHQTVLARELSGIMKPTAPGLAPTLVSLPSPSTVTISSPPRNLHSQAEADLSLQNHEGFYSSPIDIPSVSFESNESMQMSFEPERLVKPRTSVRKLQLPNWGFETKATEPALTADSSVITDTKTSQPLKKNIEASPNANTIPEMDTSCQNLKFNEKMVKVVAAKSIPLDISSENIREADSASPIQLDVKGEHINSQLANNGSTVSLQLPQISNLVVELPSRSSWCALDTVPLRQPIIESKLPTKNFCKNLVPASPIKNSGTTSKLI